MMSLIMPMVMLRSQSMMVIRALGHAHLVLESGQHRPVLTSIATHSDLPMYGLLQSFRQDS